MRWTPRDRDPLAWRRTFALFPVDTLDGVSVWLEHVETRSLPPRQALQVGRTIYRLHGSTADLKNEPPHLPCGGLVRCALPSDRRVPK